MLVPASMFLVPVQAQEDQRLVVSTSLGGSQDIPLKAIKDSDDNIDTQNDFEIEPQHVISVEQGHDFHVVPSEGSLIAVKATNPQRITTDLEFSQADGRVTQNLPSNPYLLDVIVEMDNDDRFLYETVLAVLAPGQTINQVNVQNIIQNFVSSTSSSHTTVVFKDDNDDDDEPPDEEPSICYFEPNDAPECEPDEEGNCPNDWPMNEQGNCHPGGECPDDFSRVDDDESGTCYPDDDITICEGSGALVLDPDDCAIYEPDEPGDPAQICYFEPNDPVCNPDENGQCPEGMGFNDDEQCIPQGDCPDGYARLDDDETGRCYAEAATKICPPNNIRVLQSESCPESVTEPEEPEPEPITCEEGFVLENGRCAALDSNCGGVPCTASDKENSTTSDPIPGEPHTPTEETEEDSEGEEEQGNDEQAEEEQPEQEEPNAENSNQAD